MFDMFLSVNSFLTYFLVVVRIGAMFLLLPVYNSSLVNSTLKMYIALLVGVLVFPHVTVVNIANTNPILVGIVVAKEAIIGILLALASKILFEGVLLGAQLMTTQMGLSMASMYDPQLGEQVTTLGQVYNITMILIFILGGGIVLEYKAMMMSFKIIPVGAFIINFNVFTYVAIMFGKIFSVSLQIFAPIFVTLLVVNVMIGIIGKLVPQMNLLVSGIPMQITSGLFIIVMTMPYFGNVFLYIMENFYVEMMNIISVASQHKFESNTPVNPF